MKKTRTFLKGLVKQETFVFISRSLEHIEFTETTKFLGWTVKEETREVFLPHLKTLEDPKLKVIADAYRELHEISRRLKYE
jgi:hypothetical protein